MWYFSSISSASQAYTTPEEPAEKRVRVSLHQAMQICAVCSVRGVCKGWGDARNCQPLTDLR